MKNLLTKKIAGTTFAGIMMVAAPASVLLTTQTAIADTDTKTNEMASQRLNKLLGNVKGMSANFTQKTVSKRTKKGSLSRNRVFSGSMMVQRPNNLRWETKSPSEQLIVANGNQMWVYDKDLEQVTKQNANSQLGNTPALLLSGDHQKIAKNFKITQPNPNKHYYKLYPKSKGANFKNMIISFSGGKPAMMVLNDSLGQTTSIKFSNIKLNPKISASKFKFKAPAGVDMISQ